ncbi:gliding motility protein GldN [Bacteroidales bacterium OttesenSCG-928-B11]|nr:gliding motility protein GldN [Bacteroidales bacterium OttesenSCG-928-C03]MDL2311709.1 gliding motility protein GldN [Bacteroidales bacterium OttesenSCG-928-B11]MDL2325902.1 gliding motility protein GldN [Bacteroidales bacterium OttesenSCG-928-A14]
MKKFSFLLAIMVACSVLLAQEDQGTTMDQPVRPPLETPWAKVNTGEFSEPVPYQPTRESDIMYFRTIWRVIDLREKMNHPLYFPTATNGTWRSLAQLIFDAVDFKNEENMDALPVYTSELCDTYQDKATIRATLSETSLVADIDLETGEYLGTKESYNEFQAYQVYSYRIKEVWFFDKQRSVLDVRILEIEPMVEYERPGSEQSYEDEGDNFVELNMNTRRMGYIMYDELRPYLVKQEIFNVKNNAARLSMDDLLTFKRQFASYIFKEDNVYDRDIQQYMANPRDQRIESERITNDIRVYEHDLWEL